MSYDIHAALAAGVSPSDIASELASNPDDSAFDVEAARKAGLSDDAIVKEIASKTPTNILGHIIGAKAGNAVHDVLSAVVPGSIQRGLARDVENTAKTADVLGAPEVGSYLHSQVNKDLANAPSSQAAVGKAWNEGRYGDLLSNVPGAVGEGVGQLTGAALATAAGTAIGGVAGTGAGLAAGIGGNALLGIITQAGSIAQERAKADGRETPNDEDIAIAVGSSGVLGALNRIGLGQAAGSMVANGVKTMLGRGAAGKVATAVGSAAVHGAVDAGTSVGQQLAETAGTAQGATVDPGAAVAQAITGAGTRLGLSGARLAGEVATGEFTAQRRAAAQEALRQQYTEMAPEDQTALQNVAAGAKALTETRDADTQNPKKPNANVAARTATADMARDLGRVVDGLELGSDDAKQVRGLVENARNTQRSSDPAKVQEVLDTLPVDEATKKGLADGIAQLDMLSTASIGNRNTSTLGNALAAAGAVLGTKTPHPFIGANLGAQAGQGIGNMISRKLGWSDPALIKEGAKAAAMLDAAGVPIPETRAGMLKAIGDTHNAVQAQARALGLDPAPYGWSPAEARAVANDATVSGDVATLKKGADDNLSRIQDRMAANDEVAQQASQTAAQAPQGPAGIGVAQARAAASSESPAGSGDLSVLTASRQPPQGFQSEPGKRLPDWQYGVSHDAAQALHLSGAPKGLNYAHEALKALGQVRDQGVIDGALHDAIASHHGRLVEGIYTLIRNQVLLNHGIDRRHADAQHADQARRLAAD